MMIKLHYPEFFLELNYEPFDSMTDEELVLFCVRNKGLQIERDELPQLSIMPLVIPYISNLTAGITFE